LWVFESPVAMAAAEFGVVHLENGGNMKLKTGIAIFFMLIFSKTALAAEPYNYAELWRSWNIVAREAYITGVVDGIAEAFIVTLKNLVPDKLGKSPTPTGVKKTTDKLFVRHTKNRIRDVMTDLYKDPANSFIHKVDMFFLARDKIEGKDIGKGLMEARKKAMEIHQLNEYMQRK
jgi:hypothetical protein